MKVIPLSCYVLPVVPLEELQVQCCQRLICAARQLGHRQSMRLGRGGGMRVCGRAGGRSDSRSASCPGRLPAGLADWAPRRAHPQLQSGVHRGSLRPGEMAPKRLSERRAARFQFREALAAMLYRKAVCWGMFSQYLVQTRGVACLPTLADPFKLTLGANDIRLDIRLRDPSTQPNATHWL